MAAVGNMFHDFYLDTLPGEYRDEFALLEEFGGLPEIFHLGGDRFAIYDYAGRADNIDGVRNGARLALLATNGVFDNGSFGLALRGDLATPTGSWRVSLHEANTLRPFCAATGSSLEDAYLNAGEAHSGTAWMI